MAKVIKRTWMSRGPTGHRVRKVAWGYTLQVAGAQLRKFDAAWDKDGARDALAARILERDAPKPTAAATTFGQAVERYLQAKARKKSVKDDGRHLAAFTAAFGAGTPLADVTAGRISAWRAERLAATCPRTGRPYSAASVNRPLAALRHLLQLARDEWEILATVPRIRFEREPQGRVRWLGQHAPDDETRLLAACRASRNPQLANIVILAMETGMRKAEVLGLTWDRVDLSRGVIRLEVTKSGRRREVPMRQAVYEILSALPAPRHGKVWAQRKVRTAFENAVAAAGLEDFNFHDLRHHFASWFAMRGGSLSALKEILGHADLKMTLRYAHLAPEHLRSEIAKTERRRSEAPELSTSSAQSPDAGLLSEGRGSLTH